MTTTEVIMRFMVVVSATIATVMGYHNYKNRQR